MTQLPLTILSVAYPLFPVSADSAGGAEQVLHSVERGLVDAGNVSLVVAAEGSCVAGRLFQTRKAGPCITDEDRIPAQEEHLQLIQQILASWRVDLIHFHGLDFHRYVLQTDLPMVATLHLPTAWYSPEVFSRKDVALVCVSHSQASALPDLPHHVVNNGIELPAAGSDSVDREGLLWLGRVCPEKGTHIAVRVARAADLPLKIAGPVHGFAAHTRYFREEVEPLLDETRTHLGAVGKAEKFELLRKAKALLVPSLAAETSSLVAMEAASVGCPVIAFKSGALPEIVINGLTGFIVDSEEMMIAAIRRLPAISAQACIAHAAQHFSAGRMVRDYLDLYRRLLNQAKRVTVSLHF